MPNEETPPCAPAGSHPGSTVEELRFRIKALYHCCHSSAAFKREDAAKADDEAEAKALRREAAAFEQCASWLHHATGN